MVWLAFLGLYEWSGVNAISPELHLLPSSVPLYPGNYYCHTRHIYAGLAYLYGVRFRHDLGALGAALGMTPVFWTMAALLVGAGYFVRKPDAAVR